MTRQSFLKHMAAGTLGIMAGSNAASAETPDWQRVKDETFAFICKCRRPDGGYAPSPDADYAGNSDTGLSDMAGVTYAAVLAKTVGWELPEPKKSIDFIHSHQKTDGSFVNLGGKMKPDGDLAILYNTTQGVVSLRALGQKPNVDPSPVMKRFFDPEVLKKLPWYTTSFFPLFYAALEKPFPADFRKALSDYMIANQTADGYLQNHIAATYHMAHFYRLVGEDTPRGKEMLARALKDQKSDGGWNIHEPDWDVHACFDAVYVVKQLGGDRPECKESVERAASWVMRCRNSDGGFAHYPTWHSDMDAVYFNFGTLIQAGKIPGTRFDLPDGHTLSWGHAMVPGKKYG
jgi:hypothetical protein